jgi:DNA-binding GntR family transcriptional regulator
MIEVLNAEDSSVSEIERPSSLAALVAERLTTAIIDGTIEPGALLSEKQMAAEFGTSKTPVREAFAELQSLGLLEVLPQRGGVVFRADETKVHELCEVRLELELVALRLSFERNRNALVDSMGAIVAEMRDVYDVDHPLPYLKLDHSFHTAMLQGCHNSMLQQAYDLFGPRIRALRSQLSRPQSFMLECSIGEHADILHALEKDDLAAAMHTLTIHIQRIETSQLVQLKMMEAARDGFSDRDAVNA